MSRSVRSLRLGAVVVVVALVVLGLAGCEGGASPRIGTATAGAGQAVVSWQPPLAYRPPITGYEVTPWIGITPQTMVVFNSSATTQTVTGLTNGVTYTFSVRALDGNGNETTASARSNPVTPVPPVGPELPVSDPVYGPNRHGTELAQAAFDGTNFFVVWYDHRRNTHPDGEAWGARIAPDGTVLDPAGIRIPGGGPPEVAFDGTTYLVVWATGQGVAAVRVSTTGVVLDSTPIQVVANVSTVKGPKVSVGNGSSLIVWGACEPAQPCAATATAPGIQDVLGARIASDGTVLDPTPITIAQTAQGPGTMNLDVAFDGTNYLVGFERLTRCCPPQFQVQYAISARQVSSAGTLLGSQFNIVSGLVGVAGPSLSFDGTNVFAIWYDGDARGARVSPAGVVLDPAAFDVSAGFYNAETPPAVAFDGTNTVVAWEDIDGNPVFVRRVSGTGTPVDPAPIPVAPDPEGDEDLSLTAGNGLALVTYRNGFSLTSPVEAVRVDNGTVLDNPPFIVSTQANDQTGSAIAPNGTGSFVFWSDDRSGPTDIYGARVQDGSMLDGAGIAISTAAGNQNSPAVVFDGTGYFVVWVDARSGTNDIYGARVTADGVVLDPGGIQITNTLSVSESVPAIAFDGTNYFVVWSGSSGVVSGARVSTSGSVLDPTGVVLATTGTSSSPAVAFGGGSYFVAWQVNGGVTTPDIAGERVGTDGTVLDPAPLTISNLSSSETAPQVAFNGSKFLVVWEDQRNGSATDIYGARVSPGGAVLDPSGVAISTAPDLQREPQVAANETTGEFFVVWRDDRRRGAAASASDVFGARVTDAGVVRDPSGVSITSLNQDKREPVVAPNAGTNGWDVAYTRFAGGTQYGSFRVFHRSVNLN
jgi:hypothetical protein